MTLPTPQTIFNPLTSATPLTPLEIIAGPLGLLLFIPLIPLVRLAGRRWPRAAIASCGGVWLLATAGPWSTLIVAAFLAIAVAWITLLGYWRRRGLLSERAMTAAVWVGVAVLVVPLWWQASWWWYGWGGSRLQALHNLGLSYFMLRLIGWGVDLAKAPATHARLGDTIAWLMYPPGARLGPFLGRTEFVQQLAAWTPGARIPWREVLSRSGLCLIGLAALFAVGQNTPSGDAHGADYFAAPQQYSTSVLVRVWVYVPLMIYLVLWTCNELACATSLAVGIRTPENFHWVVRSSDVRDFWRRWNTCVGGWLRSYIYIPLGGSRRWPVIALGAAFLFCGVWHGPAWSFLAWAAAQVAMLSIQRAWDKLRPKIGLATSGANPAWRVMSGAGTLVFQATTLLVLADFEHCGVRFLPELLRRCYGLVGG